MKEQTLMNMKHDMGKIAEALHNNIQNIVHINTLTQGLLETIKLMPGYKEAIDKLLENQAKQPAVDVEQKLD
jgi:hypothetical protein|tara:strand:+ start:80 stop:295 length:216 start_codon:yes stop_codon:yes gene_type:complete